MPEFQAEKPESTQYYEKKIQKQNITAVIAIFKNRLISKYEVDIF